MCLWRNMEMIVLIVLYGILGYWAAGKTVYRNYIMIGDIHSIIAKKLTTGIFFGWILIPIAIIMCIIENK